MSAEVVRGEISTGERPASGADAKKGRESGQERDTGEIAPIQSKGLGEQAGAARSAARPAALPCQNSNNYPKSPYRLRKTAVTYRGIAGQGVQVTSYAVTPDTGVDREGRNWLLGDDGKTWETGGGVLSIAEAKRGFALRRNLESFFAHYGGRFRAGAREACPSRGMEANRPLHRSEQHPALR